MFDRSVAVVGDIHGRSDLLDALLAALPPDLPLVVVGDVCDRGPDTRGVIDRLLARGASGAIGNHEEWLLAWVRGEGFDSAALGRIMGGEATLASYGVEGRTPRQVEAQRWRVPAAHRAWLEGLAGALELTVRGERFWVTHAGAPPGSDIARLAAESPRTLRWPVTVPESVVGLDAPLVYGHVVLPRPVDTGAAMAIDTGCGTVADGTLTAVLLPERRFVTVG